MGRRHIELELRVSDSCDVTAEHLARSLQDHFRKIGHIAHLHDATIIVRRELTPPGEDKNPPGWGPDDHSG